MTVSQVSIQFAHLELIKDLRLKRQADEAFVALYPGGEFRGRCTFENDRSRQLKNPLETHQWFDLWLESASLNIDGNASKKLKSNLAAILLS